MKMVKSLLLGSAAGAVAFAGAQAADLPVKARPVQYVKICSLYGAGFYYIPGTDTCIKVGGYMRAEVNYQAGGSFGWRTSSGGSSQGLDIGDRNAFLQDWRTRAAVTFDTRSQTEYGTLRSYMYFSATDDNSGYNSANADPSNSGANGYIRLYAPVAFIQWAGFTVGKTTSFFAYDTQPYTNGSPYFSDNGVNGNGVDLWAYTAQFGNGLSATLSLENADAYDRGITNGGAIVTASSATKAPFTTFAAGSSSVSYGNQTWPDIVGNLRIDQSWGGAQVMGHLHDVRSTDISGAAGTAPGSKTAWSVGGGLKFNLPMLGKDDNIIGQVTYTEGIMNDVAGNGNNLFTVTNGYPETGIAIAPLYDAVVVPGNTLSLTKAWSFTGGYEHHWNPQWKTSIYGEYGSFRYTTAASAVLVAGSPGLTAGSSANWSGYGIGSRTVWTPVENLDLSVEVLYSGVNTAFAGVVPAPGAIASGTPTVKNEDWWSGIVRVQRNFWP